jgi:hypothetical protein
MVGFLGLFLLNPLIREIPSLILGSLLHFMTSQHHLPPFFTHHDDDSLRRRRGVATKQLRSFLYLQMRSSSDGPGHPDRLDADSRLICPSSVVGWLIDARPAGGYEADVHPVGDPRGDRESADSGRGGPPCRRAAAACQRARRRPGGESQFLRTALRAALAAAAARSTRCRRPHDFASSSVLPAESQSSRAPERLATR